MFVLSRLFVPSLNIPRHKELEGTKLLKDGNKSVWLEASHVTSLSTGGFCLPVFDGGSFPTPFSLLLGSSHTTKACLAEW